MTGNAEKVQKNSSLIEFDPTRSTNICKFRDPTRGSTRPACNSVTTVVDMPSRSSLRASSNGNVRNLFLPRMERRFGDHAFILCRCTLYVLESATTELKLMRSSTTTFKRHLKTSYSTQHTPLTDYGMRHRTNCRRRITNTAVTVTGECSPNVMC